MKYRIPALYNDRLHCVAASVSKGALASGDRARPRIIQY